MTQKWNQKASVQTAMVITIGSIIVTLLTIWHNRSQIINENKQLKEDTTQLTAEVQRLETLLTPFRTIAIDKFTGPESESLRKLAKYIIQLQEKDFEQTKRIQELENQTRDLDKFKSIAAKYEHRPLSPQLRSKVVKELSQLKDLFDKTEVSIKITQETWTPATTQKFAKQLVDIIKESGLSVSGPSFATVFLVNRSSAVEFGYRENNSNLANSIFQSLHQIMKSERMTAQTSLQTNYIRIHFAGQTVYDQSGRVFIE